jgi:hypothetical protein
MEAQITAAEADVHELEQAFAKPDFYATHGKEWQSLEAQLAAARERVNGLYSRWAELEQKAQQLGER